LAAFRLFPRHIARLIDLEKRKEKKSFVVNTITGWNNALFSLRPPPPPGCYRRAGHAIASIWCDLFKWALGYLKWMEEEWLCRKRLASLLHSIVVPLFSLLSVVPPTTTLAHTRPQHDLHFLSPSFSLLYSKPRIPPLFSLSLSLHRYNESLDYLSSPHMSNSLSHFLLNYSIPGQEVA